VTGAHGNGFPVPASPAIYPIILLNSHDPR
jgi:hypothetical protein